MKDKFKIILSVLDGKPEFQETEGFLYEFKGWKVLFCKHGTKPHYKAFDWRTGFGMTSVAKDGSTLKQMAAKVEATVNRIGVEKILAASNAREQVNFHGTATTHIAERKPRVKKTHPKFKTLQTDGSIIEKEYCVAALLHGVDLVLVKEDSKFVTYSLKYGVILDGFRFKASSNKKAFENLVFYAREKNRQLESKGTGLKEEIDYMAEKSGFVEINS